MNKHKLLIIGGGFASVKLAKELGNDPAFDVTIVAPHSSFEYHGAMYRSANGRSPLEVVIPFREVFEDSKINFVNDFMVELRAQTKEVKLLSGRTLSYDSLALGLGYEIEYYGIPGIREHAESIYAVSGAINLRNKLLKTFTSTDNQPVNIIVAGAGPTGVEIASSIEYFAQLVSVRYKVKPSKLSITLVDGSSRILPTLSEEMSKLATSALKDLGIKIITKAAISKCLKHSLVINHNKHIPYDVVIWTAGSRGNSFFEKYPDIFYLESKGRVAVDEHLQANSPDIYVMGDSAATQFSGMAQTAVFDGVFVANDLRNKVNNRPRQSYEAVQPAYAVPVGVNQAIVDVRGKITVGHEGWKLRRAADLWALESFLPHDKAIEHWQHGDQIAQF